jgi:acetylornithine deacetylase
MKNIKITQEAISLLEALIETPSTEEDKTALLLENWFNQNEIPLREKIITFGHSICILTKTSLPLLNSHHDTV